MARVHIPRLDLEVKGVEASVVRAALERLPAELSTALQASGSQNAPSGETAPVHVPRQVNATALAAELASRVAALVRGRTARAGQAGTADPGATATKEGA